MISRSAQSWLYSAGVVLAGTALCLTAPAQRDAPKGKPSLTLHATPIAALAPARIVATGELVGGADDYEDFYCAKVQWDWSEVSTSDESEDCAPYEAGKSQIRRRFTQQHIYREGGRYDIFLRLKQGTKVVANAKTTVEVREDDPLIASARAWLAPGHFGFQTPGHPAALPPGR